MIYDVIIVGAGPAGLSSTRHAQRSWLRTIILEKGALANTIVAYHRGKYVIYELAFIRKNLEGQLLAQMRLHNGIQAWLCIHVFCPYAMLVAFAMHLVTVLYY